MLNDEKSVLATFVSCTWGVTVLLKHVLVEDGFRFSSGNKSLICLFVFGLLLSFPSKSFPRTPSLDNFKDRNVSFNSDISSNPVSTRVAFPSNYRVSSHFWSKKYRIIGFFFNL
jgi:hypothetical protein